MGIFQIFSAISPNKLLKKVEMPVICIDMYTLRDFLFFVSSYFEGDRSF